MTMIKPETKRRGHERRTAKLTRALYWTLMIASLGLWLSGAVWLGLHYFARTEGPFGPAIHPLEPAMLQLHGFFLIPGLMAFGGIVFAHVGVAWRYRKNTVTGVVMLAGLALLALTGYALYYSGSDSLRQIASLTHWITGLAAPAAFIQHAFMKTRARANRLASAEGEPARA